MFDYKSKIRVFLLRTLQWRVLMVVWVVEAPIQEVCYIVNPLRLYLFVGCICVFDGVFCSRERERERERHVPNHRFKDPINIAVILINLTSTVRSILTTLFNNWTNSLFFEMFLEISYLYIVRVYYWTMIVTSARRPQRTQHSTTRTLQTLRLSNQMS